MEYESAHDFVQALSILDNLYAEVEEGASKYLIHSKCTKFESLLLSITDVTDGCWDRELFYDDVVNLVRFADQSSVVITFFEEKGLHR